MPPQATDFFCKMTVYCCFHKTVMSPSSIIFVINVSGLFVLARPKCKSCVFSLELLHIKVKKKKKKAAENHDSIKHSPKQQQTLQFGLVKTIPLSHDLNILCSICGCCLMTFNSTLHLRCAITCICTKHLYRGRYVFSPF